MLASIATRLQTARQYLRLAPFECDSEEGRAAERYRRATWSLLASVLSRALSMAVMFLSVGLTVPYLGAERFGIWMTIASFAGMLTFLDMGIGNALVNHIAKAASVDSKKRLCEAVSGGLALLFLLSVIIGLALVFTSRLLPWDAIIKVKDASLHGEIHQAMMLFAVLFSINMFASGVQRVFAGMQRAYDAHLAVALGQLISIALLLWAAHQHIGITGLLLVTMGVQSLAPLGLLILLIKRDIFSFKGIGKIAFIESREVLHVGGLFLVLQIGTMVGWGADSFIIASTLGASYVTEYSVVQRLFQFVTIPLMMISAPLWGAYADAHARHDTAFQRLTLKRSMVSTLTIGIIGSAILGLFSPWLIKDWTSGAVEIGANIVLAMAIWKVLEVVGNAFAMFLNGAGIVRPQVWVVLVFCILTLPLKLFFVRETGISGLLWITIIAYLVATLGGYLFIFRGGIMERLGLER